MNWPTLTVIIPTFNRSEIVEKAILHIQTYLIYSGTIDYVVGLDGTDDTRTRLSKYSNVKCIDGPKLGHGANLNMLIQEAPDLILQMDDDHILIKPLEVDKCVELLYTNPRAGAVRLMGIAGHRYTARLNQSFWELNWDGPELYVASHRPHLKRRAFHNYYGYYPEQRSLGITEEGFCRHCIQVAAVNPTTCPLVYVPLDLATESSWDHIGQSWQLKGY